MQIFIFVSLIIRRMSFIKNLKTRNTKDLLKYGLYNIKTLDKNYVVTKENMLML